MLVKQQAALVLSAFLLATPTFADDTANSEAIRVEVETLRETSQLTIGDINVATGNALARFYERRDFTPAWLNKNQVGELLTLIRTSKADGLSPEDYHVEQVATAYREMSSGVTPTPYELATRELMFTDSLLRFGIHELHGRVNPTNLDPRWNFRRRPRVPDPLGELQKAIDSPSLIEYADALFARGPIYRQLRNALAEQRRIMAAGGWPVIPDGPTLKPAMRDDRVATLARRLTISGDMPSTATGSGNLYSEALANGVRSFQQHHGLDADGVLGPATLAAMNIPVETRIDQLRLNLERVRWVEGGLAKKFIVVNIAGFRAYLINDRQIEWTTKVQVGKSYHQTPVFRDEIQYVVINPTWTVPYSIATKEMLPRIKGDPDYFKTRTFDVKNRAGQNIDPETIDWSQLSRSNFPYTFVQRPGPANALGRVKFIFPNKYSVYLHDTPSKSLFGQTERAFSHGCIRTQNPFELAELLLKPVGWDRARIDAQLKSRELKTVHLAEPLPVLLMYLTTDVGPDGEAIFFNDVYERDQKLLAALNEPFEYEAQIDL